MPFLWIGIVIDRLVQASLFRKPFPLFGIMLGGTPGGRRSGPGFQKRSV
jgi:hypothetical protein